MAILAVLMTASVTAWAANDPLTISADALSYDGNHRSCWCNRYVVITRRINRDWCQWLVQHKNPRRSPEGGVSFWLVLIWPCPPNQFTFTTIINCTASGGVHLQRGDRQIFGDSVEYSTDPNMVLVSGNARLIAEGTTLTGDQAEGHWGRFAVR